MVKNLTKIGLKYIHNTAYGRRIIYSTSSAAKNVKWRRVLAPTWVTGEWYKNKDRCTHVLFEDKKLVRNGTVGEVAKKTRLTISRRAFCTVRLTHLKWTHFSLGFWCHRVLVSLSDHFDPGRTVSVDDLQWVEVLEDLLLHQGCITDDSSRQKPER